MKKRWKWLSRERKYWKLVGCLEKMLEMGQICRKSAGKWSFRRKMQEMGRSWGRKQLNMD